VPHELRAKLVSGLVNLTIVSTGDLEPLGARAIDHIAIGDAFRATRVKAISNLHAGKQVSDHFGVWCELARQR
jgi:endonuclease/exonuclease/phosphatase family metal-dependent hydrolase